MSTWTTWEELLLTSAVKRHGLKDWNAIAMELQNRASSVPNPILLTAQICRTKFHDLRRRFADNTASEQNDVGGRGGDEVDGDGGGGDSSVPWLEDLKELRMVELRRKVHGHGVWIQNLNSKVKRLEEEREQSMRENENGDQKPDLENDSGEERSENDKNDVTEGVLPTDDVAGVLVSGELSERENRSVNESNSTENRQTGEKAEERETEPVQTGSVKQDPVTKVVRADSWNDSSKPTEDKKVDDESAELRDSRAAESKEGTKESSDEQSSASLTRNSGATAAGRRGDKPVISPATMRRDSVEKSEPVVRFLDVIRSHKHGSMFEIRLESQKRDKYKSTIRRHVDLQTVQARIEDGSYSLCTTKFYLDLLLLVNNAIVFFPKASAESAAAFELRKLVLKDLNKKRIGCQSNPSPESAPILPKPKPDPERSNSLLAKQKSSAPFIVCGKRSSKLSTSNKTEKQTDGKPGVSPKFAGKSSSSSPNEDESSIKLKLKEKAVTGVRSMRRSSNSQTNGTTTTSAKIPITNSGSNPPGSTNKGEATKVEKKKTQVPNMVKKRGAADFLKRIKKSSPAKGTLLEALKSSPVDSNGSSRRESRDQQKKRVDELKRVIARQKESRGGGGGGAGGKKVSEENSPSKRGVGRPPKRGREAAPVKRGKEGGESEVAAKRPNKRTKR